MNDERAQALTSLNAGANEAGNHLTLAQSALGIDR
jgi:hypothetical protein